MKKFKTTSVCIPSRHYAADLSAKVQDTRKQINDGKLFAISRGKATRENGNSGGPGFGIV